MERLDCQLQETVKAKRKLERKLDQLTARQSKAEVDVRDEKEMNKCLRDNQTLLREKLEREQVEREKKHRDEVHELTEQVRDLMFYVETQQKMEQASDEQKQVRSRHIQVYLHLPHAGQIACLLQELQDGQIVVESPPDETTTKASTASGHSKGRKSKKRK